MRSATVCVPRTPITRRSPLGETQLSPPARNRAAPGKHHKRATVTCTYGRVALSIVGAREAIKRIHLINPFDNGFIRRGWRVATDAHQTSRAFNQRALHRPMASLTSHQKHFSNSLFVLSTKFDVNMPSFREQA